MLRIEKNKKKDAINSTGVFILISYAISELINLCYYKSISHLFFCSDMEINCAKMPLNLYFRNMSSADTYLF